MILSSKKRATKIPRRKQKEAEKEWEEVGDKVI